MLPLSNLLIVVQSWLEYLRLEDLANAEVEQGRGRYQRVFKQGVQIVSNKLILDQKLFEQLKQQQALAGNSNEKVQVALSFPSLYKISGVGAEQNLKYHPLLAIDISPIFEGAYHRSGWDLTGFDIHPVGPNLVEFCSLEELEVESLIVTEGTLRFLQDVFKRPFSTLQDFINQVDLPNKKGYKPERCPYVFRFNLSLYNRQLKEDLRAIQAQLQQPEQCVWLNPEHPAMKYLDGIPEPPSSEVLFWAAFPGHAPDEYQAQALKHSLTNKLTAVLGGPGVGKTELALHLIAQLIWERARRLIYDEPDQNGLCVLTATTNGAIHKLSDRVYQRLEINSFCLRGGNRRVISSETLLQLDAAIEWLSNSQYNESKYEQIKQNLLAAKAALQERLDQEPSLQQQIVFDRTILGSWDVEIAAAKEQLQEAEAELQRLQENSQENSQGQDYSQFPLEAYQQIHVALDTAWEELPQRDASLVKRLRNWLNVSTEEGVFRRLAQRIRPAWMHTQTSAFPFEMPITREQLTNAHENVSRLLEEAEHWQPHQDRLELAQQQVEKQQQKLESLLRGRQLVQSRLDAYPSEPFYDRFYKDYHDLQVAIFELSWQLLQQQALKHKEAVLNALRTYVGALRQSPEDLLSLQMNAEHIYQALSLVFPVISSTLQSLPNMVPSLSPNLIRLLIIDEAGATPVHQAFPSLVRSQQAVLMGDPKQIEPIIKVYGDRVKEYLETSFVNQGLNYQDYARYAPTAKDTATAYHRAAGVSEPEESIGAGIVLANHYRSVPSIIAFCSPNYPGGLKIQTQKKASALGTNLIGYNVNGHFEYRVNVEEVEAVVTVIRALQQAGYRIGRSTSENEVGVMSPFFHQVAALKQSLLVNQWRFPYGDVETVHNFQGGEKRVIIFSPCHRDCDPLWFINRRPNLLNTAVSRAQELFILVGNLTELEAAGGETRRLVQHIREHGEIRSLPS